jgi:CDP-paratose 2-epimerase
MRICDVVFHLAAQVGVTTSVIDPRRDFEINALGTLNVLEAARSFSSPPVVIYASTNKVYGDLRGIKIQEKETDYGFSEIPGVSEIIPLDLHSPYGCSKGTGEQYVRDYARVYGLKTVVFRQSCIYGPGQFGTEDQGWVAWFIIAGLLGAPVTFYGDGKQTRDLLFVDDLYNAWISAVERIDVVNGMIFNVGGGAQYSLSLIQLVHYLNQEYDLKLQYLFDEWRPGDQRIYISDNGLAQKYLNWEPIVSLEKGIKTLVCWIEPRKKFFRELFSAYLAHFQLKKSA